MSAPVVETINLSKTYKTFLRKEPVHALDNLSLSIDKGEIFGLLGPNGSGKTTTLKLLLGLIRKTSGSATLFGKPAGHIETKSIVGFLAEESYLHRHLTITELLQFNARIFKIPKVTAASKIDSLINQVGLSHARKRPIEEYSKGMARRAGLAQALINDPSLVILDEPTSGLDPLGTREVKELILALKKEGKTVLVCSHILGEMEQICDRIAILNKGRLQLTGDVKSLLAKKETLQMEVSGLDSEQSAPLKQHAESLGGTVDYCGNSRESLESLFVRIVSESEQEKGVDSPEQK